MPLFGMYQPHIAQDSPSKLLDASSAYKQCPREIEELCSTHCSQQQQSDALLAPTKDFKASVQITPTPPPHHVCQQKPIVAAINTYKYQLNKRALVSVCCPTENLCSMSVKVHSVPGKFLLQCLNLEGWVLNKKKRKTLFTCQKSLKI